MSTRIRSYQRTGKNTGISVSTKLSDYIFGTCILFILKLIIVYPIKYLIIMPIKFIIKNITGKTS